MDGICTFCSIYKRESHKFDAIYDVSCEIEHTFCHKKLGLGSLLSHFFAQKWDLRSVFSDTFCAKMGDLRSVFSYFCAIMGFFNLVFSKFAPHEKYGLGPAHPPFLMPRNCLVFWAKKHKIQKELYPSA